ncbi:MAG: ATP-binding protein [Mycobacteriales bacterium]
MTSDDVVAVLPPVAASATLARELVTARCRDWHVEGLSDDAALVVTELVGNAVRHAGTEVVLRMDKIPSGVRLEVSDASTRPLRPRSASRGEEGGRGLLLVDALSTRYGVEAEPRGKRVWAELLAERTGSPREGGGAPPVM